MKNIKAKVKLASVCATAIMTLSGCAKHTNVIEAVSSEVILVKDITDGKQRIIVFPLDRSDSDIYKRKLKFSNVGDTVILEYNDNKHYGDQKCFVQGSNTYVHFNDTLISKRFDQWAFDTIKSKIICEKQGNQK